MFRINASSGDVAQFGSSAALSRQRSRVRVSSSPPDSKGLKSNLACDIKVKKGTSSDFDPLGVGWTTSFRTRRGSRLAGVSSAFGTQRGRHFTNFESRTLRRLPLLIRRSVANVRVSAKGAD